MSATFNLPPGPIRKLIRADGTVADVERQNIRALAHLIGADTLTTVVLRHIGKPWHVMLVDDVGHAKGLPVNARATVLYHANCRPGTTHEIRGDVVVVPDSDFGAAEGF